MFSAKPENKKTNETVFLKLINRNSIQQELGRECFIEEISLVSVFDRFMITEQSLAFWKRCMGMAFP